MSNIIHIMNPINRTIHYNNRQESIFLNCRNYYCGLQSTPPEQYLMINTKCNISDIEPLLNSNEIICPECLEMFNRNRIIVELESEI